VAEKLLNREKQQELKTGDKKIEDKKM